MFETLKYEVKNNIGYITIDRPEALNAISMTVLKELHSVFEQVNDDPEVKVAILTGNGKAFVAGADIAQMSQLTGVEGHDMIKYGAGSQRFRTRRRMRARDGLRYPHRFRKSKIRTA